MARCHTHSKHSANCRHHWLPRKRRWWSCARHPSTGAEPGVFGKYWPLASTLSLPISLQLRTQPLSLSVPPQVSVSACRFCPAGGPPGHRGSCCPQPSTREAGQLHQRTQAPSPGLGLCRDRSGSLADPGVLSPENPGSLIPTSRLFTFSCSERAWWTELLCA